MTAPAPPLLTSFLAPDLPADDAMTRRILDASLDQLLEFGVRHFAVEDVARRVGINRITIYRRFAGKDDLLTAVILREGRRLFAEVDATIAGLATAEEQIVEGFVAGLSGVRRHRLLRRVLAVEPDMVASLLISHGAAVVALAREYLAGHARRGQRAGQLAAFDPDGVAELAARLSLSFLLTPESCIPLESDEELRAFARQYLLAGLATTPPRRTRSRR